MPLVLLQVVWMLFAELEGDNLLLAFPDEDVAHALDPPSASLLLAARPRRGRIAALVAGVDAAAAGAAAEHRRRVRLLMFGALLANDIVTGARSGPVLGLERARW